MIQKRLKRFDSEAPKIAMLLVVTLQNEKLAEDYEQFSVNTTYTSDKELDEMLTALKEFVSYVDVSYGERQFIRKLESGEFDQLKELKTIVYSESSAGLSRSASALVPALCELYKFKYCSNDIFTDAFLDNKMAAWGVLKSLGIQLPETWFYYHKFGWMGEKPPIGGDRLICKPAYGCASMGIDHTAISEFNEEYARRIDELSKNFNQPMMVQKLIEGYEVEVPVFDLFSAFTAGVSGISLNGKQELGDVVLSYDTVFEDGFELYNFDEYNREVSEKLMAISKTAYAQMQLTGPVRFDFRIDKSGSCYLMDYNNTPHLGTQHSFAFVIQKLGFGYTDMLKLIIYPTVFQE